LPNQVGAKALDTYVGGGDSSTGVISSPEFTITRDRIDFRIAGGAHPWGASGATAVNLVIDGVVYRTATGDDSSTLRDISWDVHRLVGRTAQLQVVDQATGSWGHLMVDQIVFGDNIGSIGGESDTRATVELIVGGNVVRTATGRNAEHLHWESWLVEDLIGQTAQIRVVDNSTGSWGHVNVDHIVFDDRPVS
jgi:levanbiose-producing levanase